MRPILLVAAFFWSVWAHAAPVVLQWGFTGDGTTGVTVEFGGWPGTSAENVTAGSAIIFTARSDNGQGKVTSISSSPSETWIKIGEAQTNTNIWVEMYIATDVTGGQEYSVTTTYGLTDNGARGIMAEVSGLTSSGVLSEIVESKAEGSEGSAIGTFMPDLVTGENDLFLFATFASNGDDDSENWSPGTGWTKTDFDGITWTDKLAQIYRGPEDAGTYDPRMTSSQSPDSYAGIAVAIRLDGGADVTAPTVSSATIATNGTSITVNLDESVTTGAGGATGWTATGSTRGAQTMTYSSGTGTSALVFTVPLAFYSVETVTLGYTQPTNGWEDSSGNELATIVTQATTNNSTQTVPAVIRSTSRGPRPSALPFLP